MHKGSLPVDRWEVSTDDPASATGFTHHIAGLGDIIFVERPPITPGQIVEYRGNDATVLEVTEAVVTLLYDHRREVQGGGFIKFERRRVDAPRDAIVLENMSRLMELN